MRKIIVSVLIGTIIIASGIVYAGSLRTWVNPLNKSDVINESVYEIYVNGKKLDMNDLDTKKLQTTLNYNGRTYIPVRKIAEALGADSESMWKQGADGKYYVNIVTPEHSKPTDFVQNNVLVNGTTVEEALVTTSDINALAKSATKNCTTKEQKARKLYQLVIDYMTYEFNLPDGVGAKRAFYDKDGCCYDYACFYMALCDAVDVNVRLEVGFVYQSSSMCGHAWNEVQLDNGRWVSVDCTWGEYSPNFGFNESDIDKDGTVENGRYSTQIVAEYESY